MIGGSRAGQFASNAIHPIFKDPGAKVVASGDLEGTRHQRFDLPRGVAIG
jgi:hypothetical protein